MPDILDNAGQDKKTETLDNAKILESLTAVRENIDKVTSRLDDFDARINELKTTPAETPDEEEEHFAPKTWDDIPQKADEIAKARVEEALAERDARAKAETEEKQRQRAAMDTYIDTQLDDLVKGGTIPKVEKADDENDKGRVARREVLGFAARVGTLNIKGVSEYLDVLHKAGYSYDPRAENMKGAFVRGNATPQGINAPVASSSRSSGFTSGKPDYKQIHSVRSLDQIVREQMGE